MKTMEENSQEDDQRHAEKGTHNHLMVLIHVSCYCFLLGAFCLVALYVVSAPLVDGLGFFASWLVVGLGLTAFVSGGQGIDGGSGGYAKLFSLGGFSLLALLGVFWCPAVGLMEMAIPLSSTPPIASIPEGHSQSFKDVISGSSSTPKLHFMHFSFKGCSEDNLLIIETKGNDSWLDDSFIPLDVGPSPLVIDHSTSINVDVVVIVQPEALLYLTSDYENLEKNIWIGIIFDNMLGLNEKAWIEKENVELGLNSRVNEDDDLLKEGELSQKGKEKLLIVDWIRLEVSLLPPFPRSASCVKPDVGCFKLNVGHISTNFFVIEASVEGFYLLLPLFFGASSDAP
ncbi:hypothetical protein MA16_Dca013792 [Dendrobium catenatum]|uniref:Uncharacterized protein n=1 Tax=Dendrobium catenatum TaxID=906689 RepID=A0A2I0W8D8_9ASPA|nr:hypothetical protein MA16_Dca013792 [Dendrobium catenatum]